MSRLQARRLASPTARDARKAAAGAEVNPLEHAQRLLTQGQLDAAEALLRSAPADPVRHAETHYLLAVAAVLGRRADEAVQLAQVAVDAEPLNPRYRFASGRAWKAKGDPEQAKQAYRRAIELDPRYAEAHVSLGIVLREAGLYDDAIACYERAIEVSPQLGVAHANLAIAIEARAEADAIPGSGEVPAEGLIEATRHALALDPHNPALHRNHGILLFRAGQRAEACDAFNRALGLAPGDVESCLRLGIGLRLLGQFTQATVLYERWLERNPPSAPVMRQLSFLLTTGRPDEALRWAEQAVALEGGAASYHQLGNAYQQNRRLPEAIAALERSLELTAYRQASYYSVLLFVLNYLLEEPEPIVRRHVQYGALMAELVPAQPRWRPRQADTKLRVGYLSADFIQHSVSFFMTPLLERHDRTRFEIFCYYNRAFGDATTQRLRSLGHHWFDCSGLPDAQLAQRIRDDGIDVLVELSGHTGDSRLMMLQHGAAPVQVGYLGYPTVSGLQALDFRITDRTIDPGDQPVLGSEAALPLPRSMFCYRPLVSPAIGPVPQLQRGSVTFGSFNNLAKVSDHTLELWAAVLRAVPGSRLLIKAASMGQAGVRAGVTRQLASLGVDASRLLLQPQVADTADHLAIYNQVDVALDAFPYNGATTTCEALWMGVPVVSLRGRTHASRMGASILGAAGKAEWVTHDDAGFVATALKLAGDLSARTAWREQARNALAASELLDEAGFAHDFEAALEDAWRRVELRDGGVSREAGAATTAVTG